MTIPPIKIDRPSGGRLADLIASGGAIAGFWHLLVDGGRYHALDWIWLIIIVICLCTIGGRRSTRAVDATTRLVRAMRTGRGGTAEHPVPRPPEN